MRLFGETVTPEDVLRLRPAPAPAEEKRSLDMASVYGPFAGFMGDLAAGGGVTRASAETLSAVWCAVNLIANVGIGTLPFKVFRETESGPVEDRTSRVSRLLRVAPNPMMTAAVFRRTMQANVLLTGNAYAEIEWDNAGRPVALWPMLPDRTEPVVTRAPGGSHVLRYRYTLQDGRAAFLPSSDVFHLCGYSHDGIRGISVISAARSSFGLGIAAEKFGNSFFGNGAWPGLVLQHPGTLTEGAEARLRASVEGMHQGASKAFRLLIAEEGMKAEKFSVAPNDAQFLETRTFAIEEVARWFNLPPHKLKQMNRATWGNVEQMGIEFVTDTLRPWFVLWEQETDRKLLGEPTYSKFVPEGLLRGDILTRYQAYAIGRQWGWLSLNDIFRKEEMPTLPPDLGDVRLTPLNMASVGANPEAAPAPTLTPAPDARAATPPAESIFESRAAAVRAAVRDLALAQLARLVRLEAAEIRKHCATAAKLKAWAADFYTPAHEARIAAAVAPVAGALASIGAARSTAAAADLAAVLRSRAAAAVLEAAEQPDPQFAARNLADHWEASRPPEILSMIEDSKQ